MTLLDDAIEATARRIVLLRDLHSRRDTIAVRMAPPLKAFLIRGPDGTMSTVTAYSERGGADTYMKKYRPPRGTQFRIKERGVGDWVAYDVI